MGEKKSVVANACEQYGGPLHPKTVRVLETLRRTSLTNFGAARVHFDLRSETPPAGLACGVEVLSHLESVAEQDKRDPAFVELLTEAVNDFPFMASISAVEATLIRNAYAELRRRLAVPADLQDAFIRAKNVAHDVWVEARAANDGTGDFKAFQPYLEEVISLARRRAQALMDGLGYPDLYTALLDGYEPGMTAARLTSIIEPLRGSLPELVRTFVEAGLTKPDVLGGQTYPVDAQRRTEQKAVEFLGLLGDSFGPIRKVAHPFSNTLGVGDVRFGNRYSENNPFPSFTGAMHEGGHSLYAILVELILQVYANERYSLGIHETASRFCENVIGRSMAFWRHAAPWFFAEFPWLAAHSVEDIVRFLNWVEPSYIRVDADEVTYNLHIMLRARLELALIAGDLTVADLPGEWNTMFKELFGIVVPNDAQGVMQDVHWPEGLIGYFPTYLLGNLRAATVRREMLSRFPDAFEMVQAGNFAAIREWLGDRFMRLGNVFPGEEVIRINPDDFLSYLREKMSETFGIRFGNSPSSGIVDIM